MVGAGGGRHGRSGHTASTLSVQGTVISSAQEAEDSSHTYVFTSERSSVGKHVPQWLNTVPLRSPGYLVMSHQSKAEELYILRPADKTGKVDIVDVM